LGFKIDHTFQVLEASLNGSTARQNIIAHNISNVNTPGFKQFLVNFEDQLNDNLINKKLPLKITNSKHISRGDNELDLKVTRDTSPGRADGNNVNLETEMTAMVKNDIYFNAALNQLNKKIAIKRYAISDGRG